MMQDFMGSCCGGSMWLAGLFGLLLILVLILAAAALIKYLRSRPNGTDTHG